MSLTAIQVKQSQPRDRQYKLSDGGGLYLLVKPNGGKYWRLKYRVSRQGENALHRQHAARRPFRGAGGA